MITSVLCEGHSIINLDNVEHPLASPDLAKAITQSEYQDRALGTNRMLRLTTNVLLTATGNNLIFVEICRVGPYSAGLMPEWNRPNRGPLRFHSLRIL
jgi:hypothetical protein